MKKVFIDGSAGTTGLRIADRLKKRNDIILLSLPEETRKDTLARKQMLNEADIVFLCLPDAAAREAVELIENDHTAVIDTSTAHRVSEGWEYGFAEIGARKDKIASSKRIANPGCHASGFVALVAPLVSAGIIAKDALLTCYSITGYSGGGKKMIAEYENEENKQALLAPRTYGLTQAHKHLPEMAKYCGLEQMPVFCPIVSSYYSGMEVVVQLTCGQANASIEQIKEVYKNYYTGKLVRFCDNADENGFLSASAFSGFDDMQISVFGNDERITLVARFDNLGKGASGAAIQNMNILLGCCETAGLNLSEE